MSTPSTLVIQRGDLPSLVLLLMQPDATKVITWHPAEDTPAGRQRRACAEMLAGARGVSRWMVSESPVTTPPESASPGVQGDDEAGAAVTAQYLEARVLLDAAIAARSAGCTRICSPWVVGPDHAAMSCALERAMLIVDVIEVERETPQLAIDLPIAERSDVELVELTLDLGAPLTSFWPCETGGEVSCGECVGCRRWLAAFDEAGIDWPQAAAGAGAA